MQRLVSVSNNELNQITNLVTHVLLNSEMRDQFYNLVRANLPSSTHIQDIKQLPLTCVPIEAREHIYFTALNLHQLIRKV